MDWIDLVQDRDRWWGLVSTVMNLPFPPPPFLGWSGTESTITEATTGLLYQPPMMMDNDECAAIGGILGRGNRSIQRKHAPLPLCPPQIPCDLTRAAAVGSWRLTA
jgi:hypothetical protein